MVAACRAECASQVPDRRDKTRESHRALTVFGCVEVDPSTAIWIRRVSRLLLEFYEVWTFHEVPTARSNLAIRSGIRS